MIKEKKPQKIILDLLYTEDTQTVKEQIGKTSIPCINPGETKVEEEKNSLFITDSSQKAAAYKALGLPILVYLHPGNREECFSGNRYFIEGFEDADEEYFTRIYQRERGMPWTIGESDRLILREMTLQDKEALYRLYEDKSVTAYTDDLAADTAEEESYIAEYIDKMYGFFGFGMWLVESKDTGEIIGRVGFQNTEEESEVELGFLIAPAFQRKGYAYEACLMAIQEMTKNNPDLGIMARVDKRNVAAIALCEKISKISPLFLLKI